MSEATQVLETTEITTDDAPTGSLASLYSAPASAGGSDQGTSDQPDDQVEEGEGTGKPEGTTQRQPEVKEATAENKHLQKILKDLGISNPDNPEELKKIDPMRLLKRVADNESYIEKLKTQGAQPEAKQELDFTEGLGLPKAPEKKEGAAAADTPAQQTKQEGQPQADAPVLFNDGFDDWKDASQAEQAINDAYAEGDFKKVADMNAALFARRFRFMAMPSIESAIEKHVNQALSGFREKELGDVLPAVRQTMQQQVEQADRDWVLDKLQADPELKETVSQLFRVPEGEEPVEFNGVKYPPTLYNKIVAKNPWLLKIVDTDPNQRVASRKTLHERWRLAAQIAQREAQPQIDPKKAQELVNNGRAVEKRESRERVRQGLNAGKGSTTVGDGGKQSRDYAEELNDMPGVGSLASLWSRR